MDDIAIHAQNLGKRYRLRETAGVSGMMDRMSGLARRIGGHPAEAVQENHFWALKDVSFDIRRGEVVGILGHNGAGKSTLLKVLTRITNPTEGWARVEGRVGMLLEVGTGFHPDLTGRENVFVGGAILGMTHGEIRRKYDDIVAFAEMDGFMDLAVRHYSSGMSLRLALSVAIHLDAEVIFLDEIWAVGDHAFQMKTWQRMEALIGSGRTFVIVAHNLEIIERLGTRCLLMDHGRLTMDGPPSAVIARYREELRERAHGKEDSLVRHYTGALEVLDVHLVNRDVQVGEALELHLSLNLHRATQASLSLIVQDRWGKILAVGAGGDDPGRWTKIPGTKLSAGAGPTQIRCTMPAALPPADSYDLILELVAGEERIRTVLAFTVIEKEMTISDEKGIDRSVPILPLTVVAVRDPPSGGIRLVTSG